MPAGRLPAPGDPALRATACFVHGSSGACYYHAAVEVAACGGGRLAWRLPPAPGCDAGYCAADVQRLCDAVDCGHYFCHIGECTYHAAVEVAACGGGRMAWRLPPAPSCYAGYCAAAPPAGAAGGGR
jgi:hypothetical protein